MLLEVTYTLTMNDLLAYYFYALRKARRLIPVYVLLFVVGLLGLVPMHNNPMGFGPWPVDVLVIAWIGVVIWNFSRFGLTRAINRQAKRNPSLFAQHHMKIDGAWLHISSAYDRIQQRWQMVSAVDSNARYIFITAGSTAYILAKTRFGSPDEAQQFLSLATQYWQHAKAQPDVTPSPEGVWPPAPRFLD